MTECKETPIYIVSVKKRAFERARIFYDLQEAIEHAHKMLTIYKGDYTLEIKVREV